MHPNGSSCECRIAGVCDEVHFILQSLFSKISILVGFSADPSGKHSFVGYLVCLRERGFFNLFFKTYDCRNEMQRTVIDGTRYDTAYSVSGKTRQK